jgi:hypothetical protein
MFAPTLPAQGSPLVSAVMRSHLTSLKALIDAILTVTSATVESTSTLNPGDPASRVFRAPTALPALRGFLRAQFQADRLVT